MTAPKMLTRREPTSRQRFVRAGMQFCLFLGLLLAARGLASGAHWAFRPGEAYQVGAFGPLSPVVAAVAVVAGPVLCILAAVLADRTAERRHQS